jgi:hypothetical protein
MTNPWAAFSDCLELPGAQQYQPLQRRRYVVDMPVDDHAAWFGSASGRGEPPVDDADLVLVVADAKFDVTRYEPGGLAAKYGSAPSSSVYQRAAAGGPRPTRSSC